MLLFFFSGKYAPLFFIKKNSNGNFSYEGVAPEFIGLMAGHFNFK